MKLALLFAFFWWGLLTFASALDYKFVPFTSQGNCLTMAGSNNNNLAGFSIAPCSTSNTYQRFTFGTTTTTLVTFKASHSTHCANMCLDVVDGTGNEVRVVQTDCDPGRKSQYWVVATAPLALPGYNWFKNFATGRCLTAESLGTYVDQYDCSFGALHQIWDLGTDAFVGGQPMRNQLYLTNCLQVADGNPFSGAGTSTGLCSATTFYQHFDPVTQQPNTWKLIGSNKCLDGGSTESAVYQYDCYSTAYNQQWLSTTFPNEAPVDYTYQIDLMSGLCLTWSPDNLSSVYMSTCIQGNIKQQWKMVFA